MKNKKQGFTLIELITVLVILAILALIATPIILNIVSKAKDSANKRSVDAYGKSIDLAVATYLLNNGEFPSNINDLTIEYTGKEVICNVTELNDDSSVYLSECKVDGVEVKDSKTDDGYYHYGKLAASYQSYKIGDQVTYNGIDFFVIANSDKTKKSVTLLKAEPLSVDEVNTYGAGHINQHANSSATRGSSYDYNGYGGMVYYSSEACGDGTYTGCTIDYEKSEIKYVVDAWTKDKLDSNNLVEDKLGYKTRLITYDELQNDLQYAEIDSSGINVIASKTYTDLMYGPYWYWTMSPYQDYDNELWFVTNGHLAPAVVCTQGAAVRPVITILKSAIES